MPQIIFDHVTKEYSGEAIISDLCLEIEKGEFFVLVGPSGSGKTSTLKMINGLSRPTGGQVIYKDRPIDSYDIRKVRWEMGYVLQQIALFPTMTVAQNIMVIPEMMGWSKEKQKQEVERLLASVGLDPASYRHRMPAELSGGERQRIGILRAIAADPEVVLMDEPFSALDPISRNGLQELVLNLHRELGTTVVFVTHNMQEAVRLGDRIGIMKDGVLLQVDTPQEILAHPKTDFISDFFGETSEETAIGGQLVSHLPEMQLLASPAVWLGGVISEEAPLAELFAMLAQTDQVLVENADGKRLGVLSASAVFDYLAGKPAERKGA